MSAANGNSLNSLVGLSGFRCIVADPPWDLGKVNTGYITTGLCRLPYETMTIAEIEAIPVSDLAEKDCHLYLWAVTATLRHAFGIVEAWGFKPKNILTWSKPGLGPGTRWRATSEYILFATRGSLPITRHDLGTWFAWPRGRHSAKPEAFQDMVETVSPGPYLELFARRPRLNWTVWGNEVEANAGIERPMKPQEGR